MHFTSLEQAVKAAVCSIQTQNGRGTGFLVSDEGHIVTNSHVIAGATQLGVRFTHDAGYRQARVVLQSPTYDLALLVTNPPAGIDHLELVDSRAAEGRVLTLGHAKGQLASPEPTITEGRISKRGRLSSYAGGRVEVLQTSAVAKSGSSGGPVVNGQGDVLAVHFSSAPDHAGIHFSIPSNIVAEVLKLPISTPSYDDVGGTADSDASYSEIWRYFTATTPGRFLTAAFLSGVGLAVLWSILWNFLTPGAEWLRGEQVVLVVFIAGIVGGIAIFRNWIFKRKPNRRR